MYQNALLISAYVLSEKNGQVYRNYYVVFNDVITQIKIDSNLDFIKENVKKCPCYSYETIKGLLNKTIILDNAETITYKEFVSRFVK